MQLRTIAEAWPNFAVQPADIQEEARRRLDICDSCVNKLQLTSDGTKIEGDNAHGSVYLCGVCTCPLSGRTPNPNASCPLGKWEAMDRTSY